MTASVRPTHSQLWLAFDDRESLGLQLQLHVLRPGKLRGYGVGVVKLRDVDRGFDRGWHWRMLVRGALEQVADLFLQVVKGGLNPGAGSTPSVTVRIGTLSPS